MTKKQTERGFSVYFLLPLADHPSLLPRRTCRHNPDPFSAHTSVRREVEVFDCDMRVVLWFVLSRSCNVHLAAGCFSSCRSCCVYIFENRSRLCGLFRFISTAVVLKAASLFRREDFIPALCASSLAFRLVLLWWFPQQPTPGDHVLSFLKHEMLCTHVIQCSSHTKEKICACCNHT